MAGQTMQTTIKYAAYSINDRASRSARANSAISLCIRRTLALRPPCLNEFLHERFFPVAVLGPVDFSHGFNRIIIADCFARRSGVQPFAICFLQ
jgi:hypothetical protein